MMMLSNPFSTLERQNFPEFSPIFARTTTPASATRNGGFRWSIDHLARLKPVEIDTDPAALVKTNGHSPDNDEEAQKAVDKFFSQKTILPSPWTTSGTKMAPKRVTFSPLPPTMAYIKDVSLVESEIRDVRTADAGTQTVLTFPVNYDMEILIGPAFCYATPDENRDLSNSSLRRKLFGQPERQGLGSESEDMQVENDSPNLSPVQNTPAKPNLRRTLTPDQDNLPSSIPLPPSTPYSPIIDPTSTQEGCDNPAASSMVLHTLGKDLPEFSPIGECSSSNDKEESRKGVHHELFTATPSKSTSDHGVSASPVLSPIKGGRYGLPPASPMAVGGSTGKTTSTPNTAVMKRQLAVSPFASPVLKQPRRKVPEGEEVEDETSDTEDLAQPLSLADLQTETYDFTNITTTTCTSYFTNMDGSSRHPLHSTAATSAYNWQPPTHSTMVTSCGVPTIGSGLPVNFPPIRGTSQAQFPIDSGVVASGEFTSGTNLTNSKYDTNEFGITKSSSNSQLSQLSNKEESSNSDHEFGHQHTPTPDNKFSQHTKSKHPDLPTILENEPQVNTLPQTGAEPQVNTLPQTGAEPQVNTLPQTGADYLMRHVRNDPALADSGLVSTPETRQEFSSGQTRYLDKPKLRNGIQCDGMKYQIGANLHASNFPQFHGMSYSHHLHRTPSRYSTTHVMPFTTAVTQPGKFTSKPVFQSSVLPSRVKLHMSPLLSSPMSFVGAAGSSLTTNVVDRSTLNTPSRYSSITFSGHKEGFSGFAEEVIRKKELLKARLQFSSPVKSTYPFRSNQLNPRGLSYTTLSTGGLSGLGNTRLPLGEMTLNHHHHPSTPPTPGRGNHHLTSSPVHMPFQSRRRLLSPFHDENRRGPSPMFSTPT